MGMRPPLKKGDLVRRNKPYDDGQVFKVVRFQQPTRIDRLKLRKSNTPYKLDLSDGATQVWVIGKDGFGVWFNRRDLWRIPDQPRYKKQTKDKIKISSYKTKVSLY